jgi:hypothetical protein
MENGMLIEKKNRIENIKWLIIRRIIGKIY